MCGVTPYTIEEWEFISFPQNKPGYNNTKTKTKTKTSSTKEKKMFEYPAYADIVGTTVKTMFGPFLTEKQHKDTFNSLVDAKVELNKSMYEASKQFVEVTTKLTTSAFSFGK